jgi:hypothetical protein
MRSVTTILMASGLLALAAPAQAADNLECMMRDYSAADQQLLDAFLANFDYRGDLSELDVIEPVIAKRMTDCAAQHGWSLPARAAAVEYRRATLIREGLRRQSPATPGGLAAMDTAIAAIEPEILGNTIEAIAAGGGAMNTRSLSVWLPIFRASGLPMTRESGEFVGSWIASTFAMQDRRTLFANS